MDQLYKNQLKIIDQILGERIIYTDGTFFLSRGHLACSSHFALAPFQTATFNYLLCMPQWQIFNGGNWDKTEKVS